MDPDDEGKVFIYGISMFTTDMTLKRYFSKYGEVLQASVVNDENGKARDFGFVVFADPSVLGHVLQDSHIIDYRMVVARKPMSREEQRVARDHRTGAAGRNCGGGENDRTKKIIVGGLPPTLSEGEFSHYFEYYGHVTDVEILCDQQMGRPRGFGVISFDSEYVVDRVLHKKYHDLGGKQVEVIRAPPMTLVNTEYLMTDIGQKPLGSVASIAASYAYGANSKKIEIEIPNNRVGVIIGKSEETIKYLQSQSGAKIQVTRDTEANPNSSTRGVELMGNSDQIAKAKELITDVLSEAESGGSGIASRRTGHQGRCDTFSMLIPENKVGLIIGRGGESIKYMQDTSGARMQVIPLYLPPGDTSNKRTIQIDGTHKEVEAAKVLVNEVINPEVIPLYLPAPAGDTSTERTIQIDAKVLVNEVINPENRLRNPAATGYSHQGYQARPPAYGYFQPGDYAGQTPQYNMTQPQYAGYPSHPGSGGYGTGLDHSAAATNQQTTQAGVYDFYSQQPAPPQQAPGAADIAGYAYGQQAVSGYSQQGQSYTQDGYGGYHASAPQTGYGQPRAVYDQQQGYNTTPGYSNVANPTSDGQTPSYGAQGDSNQAPPSSAPGQQGYTSQQPSPNSAYPPQLPTQPGYGVPPTSQTGYGSQPPSGYALSYGAPQTQKPTATQQAYAQPYSGAQRVPTAGYSAALASGYAPPPYGAPPVTQSAYGQPPPIYNSTYGNAYSQPPAYSQQAYGQTQQSPTAHGGFVQPAKVQPGYP